VPDWSKPIILLLLVLSLALAVRSRAAVRRTRRLQGEQRSLLRDIDAMQAALVPALAPELAGKGISVAYRPAEGPAAGGDFYDVFELDHGRVGIILGDVAGHGHESIEQAALVRYTLRAFMHTAAQPRAALALAGEALSEPDCDQLATVAAAIFDPGKGTLTYALAGHPAPILLGAGVAEAPTSCSSPPLGWNLPTGRRQRTISLHAGVRACFFSDGLIEARCGEPDDTDRPTLLGRERLDEILGQLDDQDSAPRLLQAVRAEATATPDDMAACMIAPRVPAKAPAVDVEELEFDLATVEGGHLQRFLDACGLSQDQVRESIVHARAELALAPTALVLVDRCRKGRTPPVAARIAAAPPVAPGERQPPPGREPLEV
jgi:serine phosphatase RsbU (regulator of sigma subunit)